MVSPCYNHAFVSSSASCVQCGRTFCPDCLEAVAGRPVCKSCLPAMRASVEQQMASPHSSYAPQTAAMAVPAPAAGGKALLLGIGLSLLIGIIGAIAIEKILFYSGYGLALLYVVLGYGIGWGLHRIMRRGGTDLGLISVGIMVVALGISQLVYAQDILVAARAAGNADMTTTLGDVFPFVIQHAGFMHWVLIAFGLLAAYRGVEARQAR